MQYESKVETTKKIQSLKFFGENNFEGVHKPSQKDHLSINVTCIGMSTWRNRKKTRGFNLAHSFLRKARNGHLIRGVKW